MNCSEAIDLMVDHLDGALDPDTRPGFEAHLEECPPCHTYMAQLVTTVRSIGQISPDRLTSPDRNTILERFRREIPGDDTES